MCCGAKPLSAQMLERLVGLEAVPDGARLSHARGRHGWVWEVTDAERRALPVPVGSSCRLGDLLSSGELRLHLRDGVLHVHGDELCAWA